MEDKKKSLYTLQSNDFQGCVECVPIYSALQFDLFIVVIKNNNKNIGQN